jgi:hypothetical protein
MRLSTLLQRHPQPVVGVAAGVAAAGVLLSADVHLELWFQGFRRDPTFGPLFLATAIGGLVVGLACVAWPSAISLLAALGFGVMTFGALVMSATVGLFGLHETLSLLPQQLSLISEGVASVAAAAGLLLIVRDARRVRRAEVAHVRSAAPAPTASTVTGE